MMASRSRYANNLLEKLHIPPFLTPAFQPSIVEGGLEYLAKRDGWVEPFRTNPTAFNGLKPKLKSWCHTTVFMGRL